MEKRDSADPERVTYTAAKRYSQRKKLSAERIADEKLLSSIRCKPFIELRFSSDIRKSDTEGWPKIRRA